MDGLSVKEAANILGVPKGRVWELIARGVLVGTPEAGGMRVYLHGKRADAVPAPYIHEEDEKPKPHKNGNGGSVHEGSPFREILTEFRNLTERYGQALLALGEARGEVAALRSRVELLEARIDLRLPPAPPFVSWSPPQEAPATAEVAATPEPAAEQAPMSASVIEGAEPEPMAAEGAPEPEAVAETEPGAAPQPAGEPAQAPVEDGEAEEAGEPFARARPRIRPRHRRRPSRRAAMEGIAMALARADDPSAPELPGGDEAGAAFAAYRASVTDEGLVEAVEEEPDQVVATGAVATSEPIPDAFLGDDALGGLLTDAEAPTTEPSAVAPPLVEEPAHEELGIEAMSPRDQAPPVQEQAVETPVYSSEWDEPDWIAEEDLEAWDVAADQPVTEAEGVGPARIESTEQEADAAGAPGAEAEAPIEIGASATAEDGTETADEFVADAIEDAFAEDSPVMEDAAGEEPPTAPPDESAGFVTSAMEDAWTDATIAEPTHDELSAESAVDAPVVGEAQVEPPAEAAAAEDASAAFVASAVEQAWGEGTAPEPVTAAAEPEPEPMNVLAEEELFPTDPTEVMNALVESGAALPPSEMVAETAEPADAAIEPAQFPTEEAVPAPGAQAEGPQEPASAGFPSADANEEELMWLGDEFAPDDLRDWGAAAATAAPITPAEDRALNRLAAERGWDDSELQAIRSLLAQPTSSPLEVADEGDAAQPISQPDWPLADATAIAASEPGRELPLTSEPDMLEPDDEVMDWEQSPTAWTPPAGATPSIELPGAFELDEALAAVARPPAPFAPMQPDAPPPPPTASAASEEAPALPEPVTNAATDAAQSPPKPESAVEIDLPPTADDPAADRSPSASDSPAQAGDEDWLAGRRGPAANAYRRLRRLFPR